SLNNWLKTFELDVMLNLFRHPHKTLKQVQGDTNRHEKLCFIGHSLSPIFILHVIDKYDLKLDSAIFVSPFMRKVGIWQFDLVNETFYKTDFDFRKLKQLIPVSYVLYSDNDPYVKKEQSIAFAKRIGSSLLFVKRAGHMNLEVNLNEFPLIFELCKTRLDLSLYQQYLAHRKELYSVEYIDPKSEEVVYLEPHEVFDEGVFKFRNLKKSGFCTFLTSIGFWDTQSVYYQQARIAAKRVKDFTRVFVVDKISDLSRSKLLEHIKLDIESGIKVHLVMADNLKNITPESDFGIWDNDYLCIVRVKKDKYVEVKLSSRKKDIEEALQWKEKILKIAIRIYDTDKDITDFLKSHS
ncbi:alpha/beta hydrolase, partial [Candidatus Gottesmanbacteria bacterium]|nr:alpha/beta hydrolase [Candidatus Gottesmanbacteria bacterium]